MVQPRTKNFTIYSTINAYTVIYRACLYLEHGVDCSSLRTTIDPSWNCHGTDRAMILELTCVTLGL